MTPATTKPSAGDAWLYPAVRDPHHQPAPTWQGREPVRPVWQRPAPRSSGVMNIALLIGAAGVSLLVSLYLTFTLGTAAFVICGILAPVPLAICAWGIRWIDRWEPEPRAAKWFAFLWGAGMSVAVTLLLGPGVITLLSAALSTTTADVVGPVIQAPLVEEFAKGLAVLILAFTRRSQFDGPVDGIVYAWLTAAGFAFTENILYFGSAVMDGGIGAGLGGIFVVRGLLSPFAHVMFTAALGFSIGYALRCGRTPWVLPAFILGLIPAIAGHMLWNGGLTVLFDNFLVFYFLLQVPLFAAAFICLFFLRRAERRLTRRRWNDYADTGWFTAVEVAMLATREGRSSALAWASAHGARFSMKEFIQQATRLAFIRQRIGSGHRLAENTAIERQLLAEVTAARERLFARTVRPGA